MQGLLLLLVHLVLFAAVGRLVTAVTNPLELRWSETAETYLIITTPGGRAIRGSGRTR